MAGIVGQAREMYLGALFEVEIKGVAHAKFQDCKGLKATVGMSEQWEGGSLSPHKRPSRVTYADVTLQRGATSDMDLYRWFQRVINAASGTGENSPQLDFDIVQRERDHSEVGRWRIHNAVPKEFSPGDWDAKSDEARIEQVVLAIDSFEVVTGL